MASVVGTPTAISSGSNYTQGAGSNRLFVAAPAWKYGGGGNVTLTNVGYNSLTRSPTVNFNDSAVGDRDGVAFALFVESELPGGANAVTATYSAATTARAIGVLTAAGIDQSTPVRTSGTSQNNLLTTVVVVLVGLTVGDLVLGRLCTRNFGGGTYTVNNGWTTVENVDNGDGGQFVFAYKVAASATETFSVTMPSSDDNAMAAIALAQTGGGGSVARYLTLLGVG